MGWLGRFPIDRRDSGSGSEGRRLLGGEELKVEVMNGGE